MIADFGSYLRDTNRRFADQHITVDQDWLGGCVEWFLSENPQISNADLYKNAYEQWLLSDLVESGTKCLPQTVQNNKNEFELTGNYALQMQYLIDIAESAYEQYRNLHDKKLDEAGEEDETEQRQRNISKKKRTLKLELTDGHSTVIAMEHCPISSFNTKLCPGTKVLIKGPMRCVNKVLFLQPKNVKILGGEVERLSIENAYENVLLKAMGGPITSTPKLDYKETGVVEQNLPTPILAAVSVAVHNHQPTSTNVIHDDDDDLFSNLDIDYLNANVVASSSTNANQNQSTDVNQNPSNNINQLLDDDDDIFLEANIPDGSVIETAANSNTIPSHNAFDDDDDFDVLEIEANIQMEMQNEERRQLANNQVKEPAVPSSENNEYFDSDFDEIFQNDNVVEEDRVTVSNDITDRNYEFKISGCPLVTILQLHSIDDNEKSERSFVLKCEILKTVESIRIVSNQYHLVVLLRDSTDLDLEVKVSNDVVAKWTDVTAEELQKMRQTIKQRPQQRQQMENILRKLSDTLTEFDGFVRIEYSHTNVRPEVTEIIENKTGCEEILRKKLAKGV